MCARLLFSSKLLFPSLEWPLPLNVFETNVQGAAQAGSEQLQWPSPSPEALAAATAIRGSAALNTGVKLQILSSSRLSFCPVLLLEGLMPCGLLAPFQVRPCLRAAGLSHGQVGLAYALAWREHQFFTFQSQARLRPFRHLSSFPKDVYFSHTARSLGCAAVPGCK